MSENQDQLHAMRHSLAHITASAVKRLWPDAKFGVGPVVESGYYYDIDLGETKVSDEDFEKIEAEMRKIIDEDQEFKHSTKQIDEAIEWAKANNQPYKEELLNDLKREGTTSASEIDAATLGTVGEGSKVEEVGFYTNGDFEDLCRGPHVSSTGKVGVFKLEKVAGAYWRGDESKPQMQRLYGLAFANQDDLDGYVKMQEEAKKRDHRKLGRTLDLFTFSDMVGSGLPMFTPRGTWLRERLGSYSQQLRKQRGFERVWTPHITKHDLYKASGHWDKFGDELFLVKSQESTDEFALKPMNCPHHTRIYESQQRSYRDLPIRFMENTTDYRDEKTGELHGLSRVRSLTQDDSHVFCTLEQIEGEAGSLVDAAKEMYDTLGMKLRIELSFRDDSDAYLGDASSWDSAQKQIEDIAKSKGLEYVIVPGEAAFYGPKIDFRVEDALGRDWQVATVQLDFVQPTRFGLEYIDHEGKTQTPVMIHCALLGTIERFLSVYIEHVDGHFPFWLAPEQVRIVTVNDEVSSYIGEIEEVLKDTVLMKPLRYNEINYRIDSSNESLGKRIRNAELDRIPVTLIVGPKDRDAGEVSVRTSDGESKIKLEELGSFLKEQ